MSTATSGILSYDASSFNLSMLQQYTKILLDFNTTMIVSCPDFLLDISFPVVMEWQATYKVSFNGISPLSEDLASIDTYKTSPRFERSVVQPTCGCCARESSLLVCLPMNGSQNIAHENRNVRPFVRLCFPPSFGFLSSSGFCRRRVSCRNPAS
jgi:hypothetical protein